jgi:hypothetical protein
MRNQGKICRPELTEGIYFLLRKGKVLDGGINETGQTRDAEDFAVVDNQPGYWDRYLFDSLVIEQGVQMDKCVWGRFRIPLLVFIQMIASDAGAMGPYCYSPAGLLV